MNKPNAIIVDIDGTIATHAGIRDHYDYDNVHLDKPKYEIIRIINCIRASYGGHVQLLFVSGRDARCREKTQEWLIENWARWDYNLCTWTRSYCEFLHHYVYMRAEGDKRPDDQIKREIYLEQIEPNYNVLYVFDDRDRVVKMWRELGLTCLQVAEGNF